MLHWLSAHPLSLVMLSWFMGTASSPSLSPSCPPPPYTQILYSVDPEAAPLGLDSLGTINPDVLPDDLRKAVESIEVYGPQVGGIWACGRWRSVL